MSLRVVSLTTEIFQPVLYSPYKATFVSVDRSNFQIIFVIPYAFTFIVNTSYIIQFMKVFFQLILQNQVKISSHRRCLIFALPDLLSIISHSASA